MSRRTDIAAFYSRWFLARIRAGYCDSINPFNSQERRISLTPPSDVLGFVFWTRYPAPMLPRLDELSARGFRYYFHVTINGYGRELEARNPGLSRAISSFRALSETISAQRTLWRYDPIIISDRTPVEYHARRFEEIARGLEGYTRRCYFSFLDLYGKTRRNLVSLERRGGPSVCDTGVDAKRSIAALLRDIAASYGITMYACCEDSVIAEGIEKAHCVETGLLMPDDSVSLKSAPTREQCGCVESVDIGAYDTCRFGCVYCYATNSYEAASRRAGLHSPEGTALWRPERRANSPVPAG